MVLRKIFYIHWSARRSPRVHEVNPGRDPSIYICKTRENSNFLKTGKNRNFGENPEFSRPQIPKRTSPLK